MFSILYVEISETGSETYAILYYLLDFSGNYLSTVEGEKTYGEERGLSKQGVCDQLADLMNSLGGGIENLVILTDSYYKPLVEKFIADSDDYLYVARSTPFSVKTISDFLNLGDISLYGLYCLKFGTPTDIQKIDMIDRLLTYIGLGSEQTDGTYIVVHLVKRHGCYVLTCCWLTMTFASEMTLLGSKSEYFTFEGDQYIKLCRYLSELRLSVSKSGLSFESLTPVFYSEETYKWFNRWVHKWGISGFNNPLYVLESLSELVKPRLKELIGCSQTMFMRIFSNILREDYSFTARDISQVLVNLAPKLKLSVNNGRFHSEELFRKDFSSDIVDINIKNGFRYCITLDCEGNAQGGCSEVGGIIFAYGMHMLVKLETFYFKQRDFCEGMLNIVSRFEKLSNRYLPVKGIPVLTYGGTDAAMIATELSQSASRATRKKLDRSLDYIDCQGYVFDFLTHNNIELDNKKLSNVADNLGVEVVKPKHSALNDAKTLFNVLSRVYLSENDFVI